MATAAIDYDLLEGLERSSVDRRAADEVMTWLEEEAERAYAITYDSPPPLRTVTSPRAMRRRIMRGRVRDVRPNPADGEEARIALKTTPWYRGVKAPAPAVSRAKRRPKVKLACKGKVVVPIRDRRPLRIVRALQDDIEVDLGTDEGLDADTATTQEAPESLDDVLLEQSEVDESAVAVVLVPPPEERETFDGGVPSGGSVFFFQTASAEADDEMGVDPEILEIIGETVEDPTGLEVLGVSAHPTRAEHEFVTATPAHVLRRRLSEPAEVDFDPTSHDDCYMLDGEHACSLSLQPAQ